MPENDILDVREAAAYLRLNEQTVRRLARDRALPSFKVGGAWRFKKSTLDNWANTQRPVNSSTRPSKERRVLVIDDEAAIRDLVHRTLEAEQFEVLEADSGLAAMEFMKGPAPDLVLLDLMMPGMAGPEVIKSIREQWGAVPVVILTGYPSSDLMQKVLPYTPVTLLAKPFTLEQLVEAAKINSNGLASAKG